MIQLKQADVTCSHVLQKQVQQLYHTAFPAEERIPWWLLLCNSRRKGIDLTAWLDGEVFCGFTASVTVGQLHFLLFFAVADAVRGCGYGSQILSQLQQTYGQIVLNVELLDPAASNYDQRVRRFAFYERNGFYDTGWFVWEVGGKFRVLGTKPQLDVPAYKKLFRKLTFGVWDVRMQEERKS